MALWPPFLLSTVCALFILNLLFYLIEFLDYILKFQIGVLNSFLLLFYIQPSFLVLAIPIGFLVALLIVYGRLSADREAVAVESCGYSIWILVAPMIGVSIFLSLFLVVFMDTILPWGNTSYLKLQYEIISERSAVIIREGVFVKDFDGYVLYVGHKDDRRDLLKDVTVELLNEKGYPYRLILAKEGTIRQDPGNYHVILQLNDGIMQQLGTKREETLEEFFQMKFNTCALDLNAKKMRNGPVDLRNARNISLKELAVQIKQEKMEKRDTRLDELEFYKKFSLPFSALAFAFIGIPLGLLSRAGSFSGIFLAVVLVVVYELFLMFGEAGGPMGVVTPFWAMWLPNGVLVCIGMVLVYWLNHKYDFWRSLFYRFAPVKESTSNVIQTFVIKQK
ncbi:MAG TPA: LptF/LptG family permease [bacterium]